jgi:hypothetical protein
MALVPNLTCSHVRGRLHGAFFYLECLATKRPLWVVESRLHSSGQSTLAKALMNHFLAWTNILLRVVSRKLFYTS